MELTVVTGAAPDGVPWFPDCLHRWVDSPTELRAGWWYVVLEEIVGFTALLLRWRWPLADQNGRLFWPDPDEKDAVTAAVAVALLRHQLYEPNDLQRRPRPGDTFAVRRDGRGGWGRRGTVRDLLSLFPADVVDISADAREAAKLAYQGAQAAVMPVPAVDSDVGQLLEGARAERDNREAPHLEIAPPPPESRGAAGDQP